MSLKKDTLIYSATAVEYGFIAVLLSLILNVATGLLIAAASAAVHLVVSKQARLDAKMPKRFAWFVGSVALDLVMITLGIACRFQIIAGRPFENVDAMIEITKAGLQLAGALALVRLVITVAIKLSGMEPKPSACVLAPESPLSGSEDSSPQR